MRVCVVGGTGNISTGIVKALLAFGHEVSVFTRGQRESRLPDGVRYLHGDRKDRPSRPPCRPNASTRPST